MPNFTFRPIGNDWHGARTVWNARKRSPFRTSWSRTLAELNRELAMLDARNVVVQLDLRETQIRNDGMVRADAKPETPAMILSFDSRYGPLRYQCDTFEGGSDGWQDNMRAIVLGLESLRQVDRYGITKRGEQYTGWKALPSGRMTRQEGFDFLSRFAAGGEKHADWSEVYRIAAKQLHPDVGGSREDWDQLQRAKEAAGI